MKCRYDPKYASQYKSKHTKHVKLSKKVRFLLDTQKEYLNREWPPISACFYLELRNATTIQWDCDIQLVIVLIMSLWLWACQGNKRGESNASDVPLPPFPKAHSC